MSKNQSINSNKKPTLIIFDEVDGSLESETKGAVDALLEFIDSGSRKKKVFPTKKP